MKKLLFVFALAVGIFSKAQDVITYDYGILVAIEYTGAFPSSMEWHNGETVEETSFKKSELKETSLLNRVINKIEELEEDRWLLFSSDVAMTSNGIPRSSYILRRKK